VIAVRELGKFLNAVGTEAYIYPSEFLSVTPGPRQSHIKRQSVTKQARDSTRVCVAQQQYP
jgi:hypothetical protein